MGNNIDIIHSIHNFVNLIGKYIGYYIAIIINKYNRIFLNEYKNRYIE